MIKWKLIVMAVALGGCSTTYQFSGHLRVKDGMGRERNAVVSWTRTDYFLRLREGPPGEKVIRLQTQCGAFPLEYSQEKDGIKFLNSDRKHVSFDDRSETPAICGEIVGYNRIASIEEGPLTITVRCLPQNGSYIAGRLEPYRFQIVKKKLSKDEPERDWSGLLNCR